MDARPDPRPRLSVVQLLPNALTLGALCAGLTAIRLGVEGKFDGAAALILLAGVLDGLDGRLARRLRSESAMGAELDSLCDFVDFGVAPALVVHLWAYGGAGGEGWIAALLYAVACALRLARFNIGSREPSPAPKTTFTGVPSPAGAMLALLPIFVANLAPGWVLPAPLAALWMVLVGALMVSRLPTPAFRPVTVRPEQARMLLLGVVALGAALLTYPWLTLVLLDVGYLLLLLSGWARGRRLARKDG
ncbi:CDP-diacylglycerol--serine O-phosphatidyltransferase [Rubellimicrobium mesophilum DSM 19309]|uniref:CDP-diacylglycerol--serine O-phosphatidyltransferase n=1 Tax=Rubellimicrobium mesophilum DSM 19309 TaxID=442562 RepID=A0A017HM38_9RHOB|nr:phosphatidylcholine/phosphatidylserine synthase [Rubellimicrobium mesophilum]EYD75421.1 CDP-diacylglycerol--serine O-phosphatidyltransferase [Rubellimicrobium mesophilum DSM 19309]